MFRDARSNNLCVALPWFGSWKNGTSSYAPAGVKRNWEKYPIARDAEGLGREILSPLSDANLRLVLPPASSLFYVGGGD